jgi:hypothetical protein
MTAKFQVVVYLRLDAAQNPPLLALIPEKNAQFLGAIRNRLKPNNIPFVQVYAELVAKAYRLVNMRVVKGLARPPKTIGRIKIRTLDSA